MSDEVKLSYCGDDWCEFCWERSLAEQKDSASE
jgi:hypothetical protein